MLLFAYRLAKELGVWDVAGMMEAMTWEQFRGWMDYASIEPFGEERADLRAAIGHSLTANVNRDAKRHPRPFTPEDFMPFAGRRSGRRRPAGAQEFGELKGWLLAQARASSGASRR